MNTVTITRMRAWLVDQWDLHTARLAIRWLWLARFYAYRGLRSSGYSRRDAKAVARGIQRPEPRS